MGTVMAFDAIEIHVCPMKLVTSDHEASINSKCMAHTRAHTRVQSAKQEQRVDHFFIRPNDSYCVQSSAQFGTCSVGTQKSVYSLSTSEIPTLPRSFEGIQINYYTHRLINVLL